MRRRPGYAFRSMLGLRAAVRNEVASMSGMITAQNSYGNGYVTTEGGSTPCWVVAHLDRSDLVNLVFPAESTTPQDKFNLRSMLTEHFISNGSNVGVYLWYWIVKCRVANEDGALDKMGVAAPDVTLPYTDPTTGSTFRRFYSIIRRGRRYIPSAASTTLKISTFYKGGYTLQATVEGDREDNRDTEITYAIICKFATQPVDQGATNIGIGLGSVNTITHKLIRYTIQEDNTPASTVDGRVSAAAAKVFTEMALEDVQADDH